MDTNKKIIISKFKELNKKDFSKKKKKKKPMGLY